MTTANMLRRAEKRLHPSPTARLDALVLLEFASGHDRAWLMAHADEDLPSLATAKFLKLIGRRAASEPVAYITGYKEFYGLEFQVSPDVLIPRPETEALVDLAIELTPVNGSLCDAGTGSGAIAISIAKHRPDLQITAADISPAALRIARQNAQMNSVNDHLTYSQSDLLASVTGRFDTITANLPYLPNSYNNPFSKPSLQGHTLQSSQMDLTFEPRLALDGGADGLDLYHRFLAQAPTHLNPGSHIILEAESAQHTVLTKLAQKHSFKQTETKHFALVLQNR